MESIQSSLRNYLPSYELSGNTINPEIWLPLAIGGSLIGLYGLRKHFRGGVCRSKVRMDGKTVIVTGSNTGIGKETVRDLVKRGARVLMACRNLQLANKAAEEIRQQKQGGEIEVYHLDLADLKSVRKCANEILEKESRIDVLLNNAGIMMCDKLQTKDGFEMQMGTNHFGHFLFTLLLLDRIKSSGPGSRIVNVSSIGHEWIDTINLDDIHYEKRPYYRFQAYKESKLANVFFTKELARRLQGSGINCYSLHPGSVKTELDRHLSSKLGPLWFIFKIFSKFFVKDSVDGAQTNIYCAIDESISNESGKYYADCKEKQPNPIANDKQLAKKLWEISLKEVGLDSNFL